MDLISRLAVVVVKHLDAGRMLRKHRHAAGVIVPCSMSGHAIKHRLTAISQSTLR